MNYYRLLAAVCRRQWQTGRLVSGGLLPKPALLTGWLLGALFQIVSPAAAADPTWSLRVWQLEDGLPNNTVTSLGQDSKGYLWVTTPAGIARFDGAAFEELPSRALGEESSQRINKLLCSRKGSLWLALEHGAVIELSEGRRKVFTNGLPNLAVESLTEDGEGAVWVKNNGGSVVCRIQARQATQLPLVGNFRSLAQDNQGRIWFSASGQVGRWREGQFAPLVQLGKAGVSTRLAGRGKGGVWIAFGGELFQYEEGGRLQACGSFKSGPAPRELTELIEDHTGAVWIGTSDSGLFRYDGARFQSIPTSHRQILSLLEDREGSLWAGTGGGGLDRIQPRAVVVEGQESRLPFEVVESLTEDAAGRVWAATQNGLLVCRSNEVWQTVSSDTNWPGGSVTCVAADRSGAVWLGVRGRRLYCWRNGAFQIWQAGDGVLSRHIHALLPASSGELWIGGIGPDSLQRWRAGHLDSFQLPPGTTGIRAMAEDSAGDIWVGTSRGRLLRVHDDTLTDETPRDVSPPHSIRCLCAAADGGLWLGYAGGGLGRLHAGQLSRFTSSQGLCDDHLSQIIEDGLGWIWLGSDRGIFKVRLQELRSVAEQSRVQLLPVRYGQGEGLRGLEAKFGYTPGVLRGRDGRLWMPTLNGLVVLDPAKLCEKAERPEVLLKRVAVDGRTLARYGGLLPVQDALDLAGPAAALRLPPQHRRLEFEFTAPSFTAPEHIRFQYQIEGLDEDWVDAGAQRGAAYSRLAPGQYRFRLRACNSQGVWNEARLALAFAVAPFFWQRWWFGSGLAVGLCALVLGTVRYVMLRKLRLRLRAAEQQAGLERERTRIARDIHDDIGNLLTKTMLLSGLVQRDRTEPERIGEHARQIASTVEQVTNSLDEIVWAVNPRNDTLPQLIDYIGQFALDFTQAAGIRCRLDLPEHPPHWPVSAELRHGLFLVVKEALNNAVRHAGAAQVALQVTLVEETLTITVQDTGCGFSAESGSSAGNGLRNMRQRTEEIGGTFELESRPGAGTRISLRVQLKRPDRTDATAGKY